MKKSFQAVLPERLREAPDQHLQRKCACGRLATAEGECADCAKKRSETTQDSAMSGSMMGDAPERVDETLRSPGQPLDAATRALMESRFGHDFKDVRVHTDAR